MTYFTWSMDPEIFELGSFAPRWYGLCFATAMAVGYFIMRKVFREAGRTEDELSSGFFMFIVGTIVGARLGHCLFYEPEYYLSHPLKIFAVWEGGLASHGGMIGIFVAMIYFTQKYHIPFMWLADQLAIPIALGAPFIRIGNFFNSEMYGKPTDVPWAIIFERIDSLPRHPSQLYEALSYYALGGLLILYRRAHKGKLPAGRMIGAMLVWIFVSRILIEFTKENQVDFENGMILNMGQILSIPAVVLGLVFYFGWFKSPRKKSSHAS